MNVDERKLAAAYDDENNEEDEGVKVITGAHSLQACASVNVMHITQNHSFI